MRFDPSTISQKKRDEWAAVERQQAQSMPPYTRGAPALHNGQRMIWFVGAEIHVDGYVFAQCYGMPANAKQHVIAERVVQLLGHVFVHFDAELPQA